MGHLQHATFGDRSQQWRKSDKTGNLFNTEDKQGKKQKEGALDWLLKRGFKADIQNISRVKVIGEPHGMKTADGKVGLINSTC